MGLINTLGQATTGLAAAEYGLNVTGQNIANLNTEGYVRRSVGLAEIPPSAGGGVQVTGARALRDALLEARIRQQFPAEEQQGAIATSLAVVETTLGTPGQSIDARLSAFFNSFATLAQDPTSSVSRDSVVLQGQQVAGAFNDMAAGFADARRAADTQIRSGVEQINGLVSQIAAFNTSIGNAGGTDAEALKDQQSLALKTLSGLADVSTIQRADGGVDVSIGSGRALVIGGNAYTLGVGSAGISGMATLTSGGVDITAEVTRGQVGGLLQVRDTLVPSYQNRLDQLAVGFAQQVNTLHAAGHAADGTTGHTFFVPLTATAAAPAGAAAALTIDPTLAGNSALVAASQTGSSDRKSTRLNSSHSSPSRMPSSA